MARLSDIQDDTSAKSSGKMRLSDISEKRPEAPSGWEKAGAFARGAATETLGGLGDVQKFFGDITGYKPVEYKGKYGPGVSLQAPTSEQVEKGFQTAEKAAGIKPGIRPELEGWQTGGKIASVVVPTGIQLGKLAEKGKKFYELSKGKEAAELADLLKTKMSGKVEDVIGTAETAQKAPEKR